MPLGSNQVNQHPQRTVCGIAVDIYSIVIPEKYDPTAIPGAWQKFWAEFPKSDLSDSYESWGVSTPIEGSQGQLRYVAGVEVAADYVAPSGFELVTIHPGNYLEVTHTGPISTLAQSYGEAYGVVFPSTGLEMRAGQHLELYDERLKPMDDNYEMKILIPVK
jgi:AraC family transcriptional regulator